MIYRPSLLLLKSALLSVVLGMAGPAVHASEVVVFAAASLKDALDDVAQTFEQRSGHAVVLSLAGSSVLARQIQYGAPADVFVSANVNWTQYLTARGQVEADTRVDLLGNRLALVAPSASTGMLRISPQMDLSKLLGDGRLAMALVDAVPAGIYGRKALEQLGHWSAVEAQVAQVDNVRAALALVAIEAAAAGVVYLTDAQAEPRVRVLDVFPESSHPEIIYPAVVLQGRMRPEVVEFMTFWQSSAAADIFALHGFVIRGAGR